MRLWGCMNGIAVSKKPKAWRNSQGYQKPLIAKATDIKTYQGKFANLTNDQGVIRFSGN